MIEIRTGEENNSPLWTSVHFASSVEACGNFLIAYDNQKRVNSIIYLSQKVSITIGE